MFGQAGEVLDETLIPLEAPQETQPLTQVENTGVEISGWEYLRTILVLVLVIGAIYLLFFFLKKGMNKSMPENDIIRVLSTQGLGGNKALYLVEVGNEIFLLSGGGDGVPQLISRIEDKETIDTIRLKASSGDEEGKKQTFADVIGGFFNSGNAPKKASPEKSNSADAAEKSDKSVQEQLTLDSIGFIKSQKDRLKNMRS